MSGGSLGNLSWQEIGENMWGLEQALKVLEKQNLQDTEAFMALSSLASTINKAKTIKEELNDVLKSIEYYHSGDYGEDQLMEDINIFEEFYKPKED